MDTDTLNAARRLAVPGGDWRDRARCVETDPDLFFPDTGESGRSGQADLPGL